MSALPARSRRFVRFLPYLAPTVLSWPGLLQVADPPARDQGVFATLAWQWLHGGTPYLDAGVEHKGPLVFAAYALAFRILGPEMWAARLLGWLALLLSALLVVAIAHRLPGGTPRRAALAGGIYAALTQLTGLSGWWNGAQTETFMEPCLMLGVLWLAGPPATRRPLAAGAALGVALLGKPTALALVPALAGGGLAPLLLGAAIPLAGAALGLFAVGAFGAAFDQVVRVNIDYGGQAWSGAAGRVGLFARTLIHHVPWPWWIPTAVALGEGGLARRWFLAALIMIVSQGRFFPYHFIPLAAPVSLLAAAGAARLRSRLPLAARPALWLALAGGLVLLPWSEFGWRLARLTGSMTPVVEAAHLAPPEHGYDVDPAETAAAAAWLRVHTRAEETVLVWGFEPALNFLSRRRAPTRFLYDYYLTSPAIPPRRQEVYWRQFRADLARRAADWIVVLHNDQNAVEPLDSAEQLRREPELWRLLRERYERAERLGDFEIFRRRP